MSKIISFLTFISITIRVHLGSVDGGSVFRGKGGCLHFSLASADDGGRNHAAFQNGVFDFGQGRDLSVKGRFHD